MMLHRLATFAKDRSSSEVISARLKPRARIAMKLAFLSTLARLPTERKLSAASERTSTRTASASTVPYRPSAPLTGLGLSPAR
jgi:hypothetical protein